jgi:ornithine cyclodeaminase
MLKIYTLDQIKSTLKNIDPIEAIEQGFIAYSKSKVVVPPVGEMIFHDPPGDVHIKYGYIIDDEYYVIKIASGFYDNIKRHLPPYNGMMLLFGQQTGAPVCILLDEGHLTNVRTAAAGAVVAKYLAPQKVHCIGIVGTGTQGKMQLEYLKSVLDCRDVMVWGRSQHSLNAYKQAMNHNGFKIRTTLNVNDIPANCNFIVTTTPAQSPLLFADQIQPGTHITAMGSDTAEKNELQPGILQKADIVAADSVCQCMERGEIHHAKKAGVLRPEDIVELGNVIVKKELQRQTDEQITIADLTGVAVQDIQISKEVYEVLNV